MQKENGVIAIMWWISLIANAIGILAGFLKINGLMYAMFGIAFMAFSHKYAMIVWRLVYERLVDSETDNVGDAFLSNEFNGIWVLLAIYVLLVVKVGKDSVIVSPVQGILVWVICNLFGKKEVEMKFLIGYVMEFLITFVMLSRL